uniref:Uncharacterized protein n=1 Tax=Amphimedon queenslandica TaxID=400682 RepID=A0A1X7U223_AMPQE
MPNLSFFETFFQDLLLFIAITLKNMLCE